MGRYVTCSGCGESQKYVHPACGCLEKKRDSILDKIKGAMVVDSVMSHDYCYVFLYTHYSKEIEEKKTNLYIRTVVENGADEHRIDDVFVEVSKDDFDEVFKGIKLIENFLEFLETKSETG